MANAAALVERATNDSLIGPDWAINMEICDILNRDRAGQAKEVIKSIKKRLGSKSSNGQLLALTLLETVIKNSGDVVHMHVAEKDVLHDMVKMAKKKHLDVHVKEKILILLDTWQEAFGGPHAKYPQYYAAYQELLRAGAVFPPMPERSTPIFTPTQTKPLSSYHQPMRNTDYQQEAPESSVGSDFPALSLAEMQNARGIMDVLVEMLNALDPHDREGLKQEVIVDLVDQCRTYKQRVVQLVNNVSDEQLLSQGLALNDDLQQILAKHDSIVAGITVHKQKPKFAQPSTSTSTGTDSQPPVQPLLLPAPPTPNGSVSPSAKVHPLVDLLSGDDYCASETDDSLALVPVNDPFATSTADQNVLAFAEMFPPSSKNAKDVNGFNPQPMYSGYANGDISNSGSATQIHMASGSSWNRQTVNSMNLQKQETFPYGPLNDQSGGSFNPLPWGTQQHPPMSGNPFDDIVNLDPLPLAGGPNQLAVQQLPPAQTSGHLAAGYVSYGPPPSPVFAYVIPFTAGYVSMPVTYPASPSPSLLQLPGKPTKAEDKLFGELVDMAKYKQGKPCQ